MPSGAARSGAFALLCVNFLLYFIVTIAAAWAVNHGIEESHDTASVLTTPARIFPIYFPMGNMATGLFIIFALLAGVMGMITSVMGALNLTRLTASDLHSAAASSLITLSLTLLAMGLASKEIDIGWTDSNLRTLEIMTIVVSATQLFCTGAIQVRLGDMIARQKLQGGRV